MTELSYQPGKGTLIACGAVVLLVDAVVRAEDLAALWRGVSGPESDRLDTVLRELVAGHGARRLPGFAFVDRARGDFALRAGVRLRRASSGDGSELVAPADAAWITGTLDGTEVGLALVGGMSDQDPAVALPFLGGITMASRVDLGGDGDASVAASSTAPSYMSLIVGGDTAATPARSSDETRTWSDEPVETPDDLAPPAADAHPGRLRLPGNEFVVLDRGAVFGRAPVPPADVSPVPHLVQLTSHGRQLSRTHLDVVLQGRSAFVRDLGSTKGSEVTTPDGVSERLQPYEPRQLVHGSVVSLASSYSFTFEDC